VVDGRASPQTAHWAAHRDDGQLGAAPSSVVVDVAADGAYADGVAAWRAVVAAAAWRAVAAAVAAWRVGGVLVVAAAVKNRRVGDHFAAAVAYCAALAAASCAVRVPRLAVADASWDSLESVPSSS
jgi:hypothetical protein